MSINQFPNIEKGLYKMENKRLCVKVKFFAQTHRLYGIVLILMGEDNSFIENLLVNLSSYSIFYNQVHQDSSFQDFYRITLDTKETLHSHKKNFFRIKKQIEDNFFLMEKTTSKGVRIKDISEIEDEIGITLRKSVNDKRIVVFASLEQLDSAVYAGAKLETERELVSEQKEEEEAAPTGLIDDESNFFSIPPEGVLINCAPVIAPIGGTPINSLREGDKIQILFGVSSSDYVKSDFKSGKDESKNYDIREATVVRRTFEDKLEKILVSIDETTYGKIEESESFNIKLVQGKKVADQKSNRMSFRLILLLVMLIFILLGSIIALLVAMQ